MATSHPLLETQRIFISLQTAASTSFLAIPLLNIYKRLKSKYEWPQKFAVNVRIAMLRRCKCGWLRPCPDQARAKELVTEIRLMRAKDLRSLFPAAKVIPERFGGLVKSWTVVDGFPSSNESATRS
jgi:hypothetical protein